MMVQATKNSHPKTNPPTLGLVPRRFAWVPWKDRHGLVDVGWNERLAFCKGLELVGEFAKTYTLYIYPIIGWIGGELVELAGWNELELKLVFFLLIWICVYFFFRNVYEVMIVDRFMVHIYIYKYIYIYTYLRLSSGAPIKNILDKKNANLTPYIHPMMHKKLWTMQIPIYRL